MDNEVSGSEIIYTCDDEDDEAHTFVSSITQMGQQRLLKKPKRLASALTSRHVQSRATTKSLAESKPIRSTSFRERLGPSEPLERRGWNISLQHPYTYVSVTAFSVVSCFLLISKKKFHFIIFFTTFYYI
jgi:hypothetical protein